MGQSEVYSCECVKPVRAKSLTILLGGGPPPSLGDFAEWLSRLSHWVG
jgi:hypothetical protein